MPEILNQDLEYLRASPSELESFLLSKDTIRQLPDLSLSVGNILLAFKRLSAAGKADQIEQDWKKIDEIHNQWKAAWASKCQLELKMRMRIWGDFLLGMAPDKSQPSTAFRHQVRNRVIMQLLEDSIPELAAEYSESIVRKDKILIKFSVENDFIWEAEVESGFPREKFWYLYRIMKYEKAHP